MCDESYEDEEQIVVASPAEPPAVHPPSPATSSEAIEDAIPLVEAARKMKREPIHLVRHGAASRLEVCVWLTEARLSRVTWSDDTFECSVGTPPFTSTGLYRVQPSDLSKLVGQQASIRVSQVLELETSPRGAGDPSALPKGNVSLSILRAAPTTHDRHIVLSIDSLYIRPGEWITT